MTTVETTPIAGPQTDAARTSRLRTWVVLLGVCLVGHALRCYGIRFGLPAVYNPDEVAIMTRALAFAKGDPNPHNFLYPTLYFYVLFGWTGAYCVVARVLGLVGSIRDFQMQFFTDPTAIYLAGRLLTALCGTLSLALLYRAGRQLWNRTAGLTAALFLAVAPIAVTDAHYVKHDVPATLACLALLLAIIPMWRTAAERALPRARLILAGAALGVATAIHYYAVFLAVPVLLVIVIHDRLRGAAAVAKNSAIAGVTAACAFFLCSPFVLLDWRTSVRDIIANRQIVVDRAVSGHEMFASAGRYLELLWSRAIGWPVVILAAAGVILLLRARRWALAVVLLSFPLVFLAFISNTVAATRYLNPVLPFLALMAGYAVSAVARLRGGRAAVVMLGLAAAVPGLLLSVRTDRFFDMTDTRTLALEFIESRVPAASTILVQPYSVPLVQSREGLREALIVHLGSPEAAPIKFALRLAAPEAPGRSYRTLFLGNGGLDLDKIYIGYEELGGSRGLAALRRLSVEYVVLKRSNTPDPAAQPLAESLSTEAERIAVFSPYRVPGTSTVPPFLHNTDAIIAPELERPGPIVEIWRLTATDRNHGWADQKNAS